MIVFAPALAEVVLEEQEPLYVIDIRAKNNSIIVGPQDSLNINKLYLRNINLLSDTNIFRKDIFTIKWWTKHTYLSHFYYAGWILLLKNFKYLNE